MVKRAKTIILRLNMLCLLSKMYDTLMAMIHIIGMQGVQRQKTHKYYARERFQHREHLCTGGKEI